MITTWSDAESMQDDRGIASSVTPLPAAGLSFTSHGALSPFQTPISGNRAGDRALASLWIRRLKPRDKPESCDAEKFSSTEIKHHLKLKEEEFNASEKEPSMCGLGRGSGTPLHMLSSSTGFERIPGAASERPLIEKPTVSVTNSRYSSGGLQSFSRRAVEGRITVLPGAQVEGSSFSGRPPLPRVHRNCGFHPRHPGYTSQKFSSSSVCRITSSATDGGMLAMTSKVTSSASKETLPTGNFAKEPLLQEGHKGQKGFDHGIAATKIQETIVYGKPGVTQTTPSFVLSPSKQYKWPVNLLETSNLKNQIGLKTTRRGGVKVQSAQKRGGESSLLTEMVASKPAIDCCERSPKVDKSFEASSNASNMATFPWEMFAEAGGPSKSARQEFVEVYNRARNELKNQMTSSLVTKAADNDAESCPAHTSRGATYVQSASTAFHEQKSMAGSQLKMQEKLVQVSQPEAIPKRQHCASVLEREVTNKSFQAYGGINVTSGKDSSSVLHNQHGGALDCCTDPSSVAPGNCHCTLRESSSFRLGFATSRAQPEPCSQTLLSQREVSQPKLSSETDVKEMESKTLMLSSKRQAGYFDGSPALVTGKESGRQCENFPSKSEVWLQRWHPLQRNFKEHRASKLERPEPKLAGRFKVLPEATERDKYVGYREERGSKKRHIEKRFLLQRGVAEAVDPELSKPCSARVIPSAAAMAIVGTAAHQFCTRQRQATKDSFAFWSGSGIPAPQVSKFFAEGQGTFNSERSSKC
ncbi:hypothetical protein L7F22_034875 [Adiantum nelumboides]|nr:hypothetical protein [Adiantum nelumboides]